MKQKKYSALTFISILIGGMFFITVSCEMNGDGMRIETPDGPPVIDYIRLANPESSDSLIASATLGTGIVIMGKNLGGTREVWFNDQKVVGLTPTWVTNKTVFVSIPNTAPNEITNNLYLIDEKGDRLSYPFLVAIPPPVLASVRNEWPQEGENLVINGNYFFEPLTVTFSGGVEAEVVSVVQNRIEVTVPDGATEGPITLATNFGEAESTFHIWDKRNIILNFDDKVGNGWRIGMRENTDGPIDGNYLVVRGNVAANQRDEGPGAPAQSPYCMEYWGGPDGRTENFYPLYPNSYREYVVKFEAKINKWYGGHLNLCLSTPTHSGSNQEIWSNSLNARGVWAPWAATGAEVNTNGQWITVVIPLLDFQYFMGTEGSNVVYTPNQKFIETAAGSFSTWLLGSPENTGNAVEFYIDNVRFVKP
ncbi:MAG TPA: glycan-binding surface protein [Cyclobacteriaceae bacterium]|nr:glycan-binding surface protein [Cyclobacteriaceae bacterium]